MPRSNRATVQAERSMVRAMQGYSSGDHGVAHSTQCLNDREREVLVSEEGAPRRLCVIFRLQPRSTALE
jgi:hypothetical protein